MCSPFGFLSGGGGIHRGRRRRTSQVLVLRHNNRAPRDVTNNGLTPSRVSFKFEFRECAAIAGATSSVRWPASLIVQYTPVK